MAENWIQGAIKRKGALTEKAKNAGKTISEFCSGERTGRTAKQCNLAKTLKKLNKQ